MIAKIEKIIIRRANFFDNSKGENFSYVHSATKKGLENYFCCQNRWNLKGKNEGIGSKIAMHVAAESLAIDKDEIDKSIVDKEVEIIKEELKTENRMK